jgi:signal transduction histidine kinase
MTINALLIFYSACLSSITNSVAILAQQKSLIADEFEDPEQLKLVVILIIIFAFVAIFGLIFVVRSYSELKKQYSVIESQHKEIADKNDELGFKNEALEGINMEKNNMISVVAHDLKTPLGNIQGLVELIKLDGQVLTKEQLKYLELLKKVSTDAADMVDVMLNVHRIESELHELALHEYDIVELLNWVIKLHEPAALLKKTNIVFESADDTCLFKTDKQYFQQIISNITQNAVDFSPKNSTIKVALVETNSKIIVSVTDEGKGIPVSDQKRLFSGYRKVTDEDGGEKPTGMGLAIVFRLLEKLHGKIDVKSKLGQGTTFTIELIK